jgi:hypothetical protein
MSTEINRLKEYVNARLYKYHKYGPTAMAAFWKDSPDDTVLKVKAHATKMLAWERFYDPVDLVAFWKDWSAGVEPEEAAGGALTEVALLEQHALQQRGGDY